MITQTQEKRLETLRERVSGILSGKRLTHTFGVEREIASLAALYMPEEEYRLRAAALLHDITKECSSKKQLQLCEEFGIIISETEKRMPKTFHAMTGEKVAARDFPDIADGFILSMIRWHTTGRAGMTLPEKLLYLADYIEDTRTFDDCVKLRRVFYEGLDGAKDAGERLALLDRTLILSFDMTIMGLLEEGTPIHHDTVEARSDLLVRGQADGSDRA